MPCRRKSKIKIKRNCIKPKYNKNNLEIIRKIKTEIKVS